MSYFRYLQELQVNGKNMDETDDYNNVGEDNDTDNGAAATAAPEDTATDAADDQQNTEEATPDTEPAEGGEEPDTGEDEEDDFTLDDEENLDDTENSPDDNATGGDDAPPPEDDEADDDFTVDGNDAGGEGGDDATGGDDAQADNDAGQNKTTGGQATPQDPTDAIDDDDKRAAEEAIYDTLTDDQKRIRVLQLKIDYKDLYETLLNTMEGINSIPKNMDNLDTIKRLTMFLTKAKAILIDYVENNFDNNSYLENYTTYIKYLAIFRTAAKVIEELNVAAGIKPDKED